MALQPPFLRFPDPTQLDANTAGEYQCPKRDSIPEIKRLQTEPLLRSARGSFAQTIAVFMFKHIFITKTKFSTTLFKILRHMKSHTIQFHNFPSFRSFFLFFLFFLPTLYSLHGIQRAKVSAHKILNSCKKTCW